MQQIAADKLQTPMSHSRNYRKSEGKKNEKRTLRPRQLCRLFGQSGAKGWGVCLVLRGVLLTLFHCIFLLTNMLSSGPKQQPRLRIRDRRNMQTLDDVEVRYKRLNLHINSFSFFPFRINESALTVLH